MATFKEFPQYRQNPFRIDKEVIKYLTNVVVEKDSAGEKVYKSKVGMADFQRHIRLFHPMLDIVPRLSSSGLRVLCYVWSEIIKDKRDVVNLNMAIMSEVLKIKNRGYLYKGIKELMTWVVIAKKMGGDEYFINPFLFFGSARTKWWMKNKDIEVVGKKEPNDMVKEIKELIEKKL